MQAGAARDLLLCCSQPRGPARRPASLSEDLAWPQGERDARPAPLPGKMPRPRACGASGATSARAPDVRVRPLLLPLSGSRVNLTSLGRVGQVLRVGVKAAPGCRAPGTSPEAPVVTGKAALGLRELRTSFRGLSSCLKLTRFSGGHRPNLGKTPKNVAVSPGSLAALVWPEVGEGQCPVLPGGDAERRGQGAAPRCTCPGLGPVHTPARPIFTP